MSRIIFSWLFWVVHLSLNGQKWEPKADFPLSGRIAGTNFTINNRAYLIGGMDGPSGENFYRDVWMYDPTTDSWTQKKSFPGSERREAVAFVIDSFAYVGCGLNPGIHFRDFYQYNPITDSWKRVSDFPIDWRAAGAFSIDSLGYVMGGMASDGSSNQHFYSYNPRTDLWQRKRDFPGQPRFYPFMADMNKKGYVMGGFIRGTHFNDFFEYDPSTNSWKSLPDFSGGPRVCPAGFVIGNKLYIGNGRFSTIHYQDWWIYQRKSNSWTQTINYPENFSYSSIAFAIGAKGYCGLGQNNISGLNFSNNLYSFGDAENSENKPYDGRVNYPDSLPIIGNSPKNPETNQIAEFESYHIFGTRDVVFKNVRGTVYYSLIDATGRYIVKNKLISRDITETLPVISSAIYIVIIEHRGRRFSYKLFYPPNVTP